jgi:hypothetical protein
MNTLMMFDYDGVISVQQIDGTSHEHLGLIFFTAKYKQFTNDIHKRKGALNGSE